LLSSLYLAHLTAIILGATKGQMASPIQSVEDLVKQSVVRYGVVRNGHAHNFIQMSREPIYERMYAFVNGTDGMLVDSVEEGIEKVRTSKGRFVFIMDSSVTADYVINQKPCDLYKIGPTLTSQGLAIVTPVGSQYRSMINLALLSLVENGTIEKLKTKWLRDRSSCEESVPPREGPAAGAMGPDGTLGPVLLLVVGVIVSVVIRLVRAWKKKNTKKAVGSDEENSQQ
ncbi:hypothetical protein CAPTEDRAFT_135444, partial [Capitella teleta]